MLRKAQEDLTVRFPPASLTADDRRVIAWVRALRLAVQLEAKHPEAGGGARAVVRGPRPSPPEGHRPGGAELKLLEEGLAALEETLEPLTFASASPEWLLRFAQATIALARGISSSEWSEGTRASITSRCVSFDHKLFGWSSGQGTGAAAACMIWLAWERGRGPPANGDGAWRRTLDQSIALLRQDPRYDARTLEQLKVILGD
jgi:hypothetical protein